MGVTDEPGLGLSPRTGGPGRPTVLEVSPTGLVEAVGEYRVTGRLGRGGMGIVYEVQDRERRSFALKLVEARLLGSNESNAHRRFAQEIALLAKIDHPHIVRMHDSGFAEHPMGYQVAYLVMERLEGESLETRLLAGDLFNETEIYGLAREVSSALAYLHERGVLHRDVKPGNLYIENTGRVVLMDFGLARSADMTRLTRTGHVIGTAGYMSPESMTGAELTGGTDVFALGAVLYECLVGQAPFQAQEPTAQLHAIMRGPPWPDPAPTEISDALRALITRMVHHEASARPSAEQVRAEADAALVARGLRKVVFRPAVDRKAATDSLPLGVPVERPTFARSSASGANGPLLAAAPEALLERGGPSWTLAVGLLIATATAAFAGGLAVGRASAPIDTVPVVVEVPPPPPPPVAVPPPAPPPRTVFTDAEKAFRFGAAAFERGEYGAAEHALTQAVELNPVSVDANFLLGRTKLELGKLSEARPLFDLVKTLRPQSALAEQVDALLDRREGR